MQRMLAATAAACCLGVLAATLALAASRGGGSGTTELGPFHGSGIQIGGSCGNTWGMLNNITTRYSVYPPNRDGTTTAVQTVDGVLTTIAGKSPGACVGGPDNGNTIAAGVRVKLHATEMETISGGAFNPTANAPPSASPRPSCRILRRYGNGHTRLLGRGLDNALQRALHHALRRQKRRRHHRRRAPALHLATAWLSDALRA